jgi:uncharacterized protein YbaR (Trm112 family)|tara:strand:- start:4993 stop:5244 length:252 start_codon:yes stop_codon:yes gene_type:complete
MAVLGDFAYTNAVLKRTVIVDKKLLSILVCPVSKAPLEYDKDNQELVCRASGLAYPIRDGIPVMLETEARQLGADEKLRGSSK